MEKPRILVLYYSRTGTTCALARAIQKHVGGALERICDRTQRSGVLGYLRSLLDALFRRPIELLPTRSILPEYDLVMIGGPVWNGGIASPVRAFLDRHRSELPRVAFFCTYARSGSAQALREMAHCAGQSALVTLDVRRAEIGSLAVASKLRTFAAMVDLALSLGGGPTRRATAASDRPPEVDLQRSARPPAPSVVP